MAKTEPKTVGGHKIEDLYAALRRGRRLPPHICRNYEGGVMPFYVCKGENESVPVVEDTEGGSSGTGTGN